MITLGAALGGAALIGSAMFVVGMIVAVIVATKRGR